MSNPDHTAAALAWLHERGVNASPDAALDTALAYGFVPPGSQALVAAGRDVKTGRFTAGNPGRKPGSKNRLTQVEELLGELTPAACALVEEHINVKRDVEIAVWLLERFIRPSRHHIDLASLPAVREAKDIPEAIAAIAAAVATGELSVEDASLMTRLLQQMLDTLETAHRLRGSMLPAPVADP